MRFVEKLFNRISTIGIILYLADFAAIFMAIIPALIKYIAFGVVLKYCAYMFFFSYTLIFIGMTGLAIIGRAAHNKHHYTNH